MPIESNYEPDRVYMNDVNVSEHVLRIDGLEIPRRLAEGDLQLPVGVTRFKDIKIDGVWRLPVCATDVVPFSVHLQHERFLGVDWYPETIKTHAIARLDDPERDGTTEIGLTLVGPVDRVRAEWWRRAGWKLLTLLDCCRPVVE